MTATAIHLDAVTPDLHAMLRCAAEVQGRSIEDFVMAAAREVAQRVMGGQREVIQLSPAASERLAEALRAPAPPTPAMKRAAARHAKLLRVEE